MTGLYLKTLSACGVKYQDVAFKTARLPHVIDKCTLRINAEMFKLMWKLSLCAKQKKALLRFYQGGAGVKKEH